VAVAAVTPRVRTIVICDEAVASPTESDVFTLEGVRVRLQAERFPWHAALSVYLLLSSARKGKYAGRILLINERNEKPIRYGKFLVTFEGDHEMMPIYVDLGQCVFAESGPYRFEIHFSVRDGGEAQKGEHPFHVLAPQE
jgi:hypothetical protein